MLKRRPTFVVAALLGPPILAQSVSYRTQSCMRFLGTLSCALQATCEQCSAESQAWRRKLRGSASLWSMVFMMFLYVCSTLKSWSSLIVNMQHFLWDFRFSDPYKTISYDTLRSDDLGKWGKHLWVLLLKPVLEDTGSRGKVTHRWNHFNLGSNQLWNSVTDHHFTRMANFPRWNHLKHFNSVTTTKFTDGNAFYDILKVRGTIFELITMSMLIIL